MKFMKTSTSISFLVISLLLGSGCDNSAPVSNSGVYKADAHVKVGSNGMTVEQTNIKSRVELESEPGAIKHLYVVSPYSGQCLIYSTVKGKVTSSGKRLSPTSISSIDNATLGWAVKYGKDTVRTMEPLQDDGTYGSSEPYIYWFDVRGGYHQHFFTGGQIIHVSDRPLAFPSIIMNIESQQPK